MLKAADGNIYVAGQFKNVNGVAGGYLVKLNPVTGEGVTAFNATPNGWSTTSTSTAACCSPSGTFTKIRNLVRTNFAMLNAIDRPGGRGRRAVHRRGHRHHPGHAPRRQPDGAHLVVIGNFTQVGGQYRPNIARLDVSGTAATVSSWFTDGFRRGLCSSGYDTFIRDVDFSPDGSYFAIAATGAYFGSDKLCDTASRWETSATGPLAHLGGAHRRRHPHGRRHHRRGHLRGRAPALGNNDPAER